MLELQSVSSGYPGLPVLFDISFSVEPGELVGARGLAVVIAEQFQRFEPKYSDRWIVLQRGTIQATGSDWDEAQGGGEARR